MAKTRTGGTGTLLGCSECSGRRGSWYNLYAKQVISTKAEYADHDDSAPTLLGLHATEMSAPVYHETATRMFLAGLL